MERKEKLNSAIKRIVLLVRFLLAFILILLLMNAYYKYIGPIYTISIIAGILVVGSYVITLYLERLGKNLDKENKS